MIEMEYIEIDGLLYPNIAIDDPEKLNDFGKYGRLRLRFLKLQKPLAFREMMIIGQLAEHCKQIEQIAFQMLEQIQEDYIAKHPLPEDDFWMRASIRAMGQMVADEVVCYELIYAGTGEIVGEM